MKKQVILFASILILFTSMISAYSYNPASLGTALDSLGGENLGLMIVFLVSFALITVILNRTRFFEENKAAATIISLMLTLGITYFGFYRNGINLDVSQIFYNLGFSDMALDLIVFFGTLAMGILLFIKFRLNLLLIVGGLFFALGIMGYIPDDGILFIVGGLMVIAWILIKFFGWKAKNTTYVRGGPSTRNVFKNKFYNK